MLTYETTKRLAKAEKEFEIIKAKNAHYVDKEARGQIVWGGKGLDLGREAYLSRIMPVLKVLADAENEDELKAALDAENM